MSATAPCAHSWRDDYVCKLCSAVKRGAAPLWAFELIMTAGPWAVLLALWTFADGGPDSRPVWPHNDTWRARCRNIATSTLQGHINTLLAQGWIRLRDTERREFELAWFRPFEPAERTPRMPENLGTPRKPGGPKTWAPPPENLGGNPRKPGPHPPKTWAHTYSGPGDLPASDLVKSATTPTPSESTSHDEVTHGPDPAPGNSQRGHARASLPAHTREVLDRASASSRGGTDKKSKRPGPGRHSLSERLAAVSQAALLHFDQSDGPSPHPASFAATLRVFMAEHDEETALRVLAAWEQARARGEQRPAMGQLWHKWGPGNGQDWVKRKVHETAPRSLHVVSRRELHEAEQREIYGDDWQPEAAAR